MSGVTAQLGAGGHDVHAGRPGGAAAGFAVLNRVIGDVAGGDLLAGQFDAVQQLGGDGGGVLDQLFVILGPDAMDAAGNGGAERGDDFFLEYPACLG